MPLPKGSRKKMDLTEGHLPKIALDHLLSQRRQYLDPCAMPQPVAKGKMSDSLTSMPMMPMLSILTVNTNLSLTQTRISMRLKSRQRTPYPHVATGRRERDSLTMMMLTLTQTRRGRHPYQHVATGRRDSPMTVTPMMILTKSPSMEMRGKRRRRQSWQTMKVLQLWPDELVQGNSPHANSVTHMLTTKKLTLMPPA